MPSLGIAEKLAVNHVRQASFQAPQRFLVAFPGGALAPVVGPSGAVALKLGDGHDVQAGVQLTIPGPGKTVTHHVAGGDFDGGGAGVGSERGWGPKAGDVSDPAKDLSGGQVADAAELGQRGPAGRHGVTDPGGGGGDASVQMPDLTDELGSQPRRVAGPLARGRTVLSSRAAVSASSCRGAPPGSSPVSNTCSRLTVWVRMLHDVVAVLDQGAQRDDGVLDRGGMQPGALSAAMPT